MLRSAFFCIFLIFGLTASSGLVAQTTGAGLRADALLMRNGAISAPFTGTDAGTNNSGLRLTALGQSALGTESYSIWRIRNSSTRARTVQARSAEAFSIDVAIPSATEIVFRSPIASTHRLFESGTLVELQTNVAAAYSNASILTPASGANVAPVWLSKPYAVDRKSVV